MPHIFVEIVSSKGRQPYVLIQRSPLDVFDRLPSFQVGLIVLFAHIDPSRFSFRQVLLGVWHNILVLAHDKPRCEVGRVTAAELMCKAVYPVIEERMIGYLRFESEHVE